MKFFKKENFTREEHKMSVVIPPHNTPAGVQHCSTVIATFFLILILRWFIILLINSIYYHPSHPPCPPNTRGKGNNAFGYNVLF